MTDASGDARRVLLGLGSNTGRDSERLEILARALTRLGRELAIEAVSPVYVSEALLPEGAPAAWNKPFFNLCVSCRSSREPSEILAVLKRVESELGRKPAERWAPREIDIDLLLIDGVEMISDRLKLPHPGLEERAFVLLPLADIAPEWRGPAREKWPPGTAPLATRRSGDTLSSLVGVLNLTPDSFSDGGRFVAHSAALDHARSLLEGGARVIDVGAESTRPGAERVDPREEWARLSPVLEKLVPLARELGAEVSVDTRHARTARLALAAGARWINDVTGFADEEMVAAVRESDARLVFMHSLSVPPRNELTLDESRDPVDQLLWWGEERISRLERAGISRDRLIFDPGVGFGKTARQNLEIIRQARRFHELGARVLIGHSRKSFIKFFMAKAIGDAPAESRDPETLGLSHALWAQGIDYVRVHQVAEHARALKAWTLADGVARWR